jgi:hypothetical protein
MQAQMTSTGRSKRLKPALDMGLAPAPVATISVYNEKLFAELLESNQELKATAPSRPTSTTSRPVRPSRPMAGRSNRPKSRRQIQIEKKDKERKTKDYRAKDLAAGKMLTKKIARDVRRIADKKEQTFKRMQDKLEKGKEGAQEVVARMEAVEDRERRNTIANHQHWEREVYDKINGNIVATVNAIDYKQLQKRKGKEFQQFIDQTNKKAALFLDVVIEEEYDPFESNRNDVKAKIRKIVDPTKKAAQNRADEDAVKRACAINPQPIISHQNGRETLDVKKWGEGIIQATPCGHFAKMMEVDPTNHPKKQGMGAKLQESHFKIDHYNFPNRDNAAAAAEYPPGKMTHFPAVDIFANPETEFRIE